MTVTPPNPQDSARPDDYVIEAWKQTVEVQKHFNDLQLKLRTFIITLLIAVIGAAAFAIKEKAVVPVFGQPIAVSTVAVLAGFVATLAFYLMDFGYHMLLKGAVGHCIAIEDKYENCMEIQLAKTIKRSSSFSLLGAKIDSNKRLHYLYRCILVALAGIGVFGQVATTAALAAQ